MGVVISAAAPVWEYSNVRPTRALLLENLHPLADTVLEAQRVVIERRSSALDEDELIAALQGVDLLGIRSKTQVTQRVLENAPDLNTIGADCISTYQIVFDAASDAH